MVITEITIEWYDSEFWKDKLNKSEMMRYMTKSPNTPLECLEHYNEFEIWI